MINLKAKYIIITILISLANLNITPALSNNNKLMSSDNNVKDKNDSNKIKIKSLQEDFYILGEGDGLLLKVIGAPELDGSIYILNDGSVSLPLVGTTKLSGFTIKDAAKHIETLLSRELINAQVELSLTFSRPIMVSIIGEVKRPGVYKLDSKKNDLPTLINAIESAGGLSKKADLSDITLKRRLAGKNFKYKQTNLNLRDLILKGDFQQNPYLFDGDILKINKTINPDKEILSIASTTLSPKTIVVNFIGEVNRPGSLELRTNSTLVDGILAAGGTKDLRSNYRYVEILRMNKNGSGFRKRYKINLANNYSEKNNPILNDGDSVWIRKNNFAKASDALGYVANPIKDLVSIWTLFKLVD
ncbi:polysaccharide export protein [Prochlorococcus marinus XMU1410]|uniref:SLBB domain-containing protein n=1 Tax=Prochlorococcus marinus TaxID=1219 RepID=UPI001ADBC80E|nr:polysaccharide biosynthesis/export family protein [Prochlorococcus marinus]MBO8242369.1 polysaccharide export protein [Prochlorococcus marinus XMU1410]MBW3053517.1 sugar transporter [Prochlorococcus marinus str. MU1410]